MMKIIATKIADVFVVESTPIADARGFFSRLFCENELSALLGDRKIVQINQSRTVAVGAIRGLHYQRPPRSEMKLIRCLRGRVLDVAVDLRAGSPTFLQYHAEELSPQSNRMMVIPEGCGHGFQVLEENSEMLYLHTEFYGPSAEGAVRYNDPAVNIAWPLPVIDLSPRDAAHPLLDQNFKGL